MSTDFDIGCMTCGQMRHLGQRMGGGWSFGYGSKDSDTVQAIGEFIEEHCGHDLRIRISDAGDPKYMFPESFLNVEEYMPLKCPYCGAGERPNPLDEKGLPQLACGTTREARSPLCLRTAETSQMMHYQHEAGKTAVYPPHLKLLYPALGLAGEVGEFCNKVKKIYRDDDGLVTHERSAQLHEELGGILWYVAQCCTELGFSLDDVADSNLALLKKRAAKGTIHGDNRQE